ncbi:hypothetical protein RJZ56_001743 [Blastomyces dermatitidis]
MQSAGRVAKYGGNPEPVCIPHREYHLSPEVIQEEEALRREPQYLPFFRNRNDSNHLSSPGTFSFCSLPWAHIIRAPVTSTCCGALVSTDDSNYGAIRFNPSTLGIVFEVEEGNFSLLDEGVVVLMPLRSLADEWSWDR